MLPPVVGATPAMARRRERVRPSSVHDQQQGWSASAHASSVPRSSGDHSYRATVSGVEELRGTGKTWVV